MRAATSCWLAALVITIVIANCTAPTSPAVNAAQSDTALSDSTIARAVRWRLDSLGCLNYRSVELANAVLNELPENYKNCDSILSLLGTPNEKSTGSDYITYIYYFQIICEQMEGETPDMQWIEFTFMSKDHKFDRLSFGAN